MKTPFRWDGHGVNDAEGTRLATLVKPTDFNNMHSAEWQDYTATRLLLAAAPALLTTLNNLLAEVDAYLDYEDDYDMQVAADNARRVIAKAQGVK